MYKSPKDSKKYPSLVLIKNSWDDKKVWSSFKPYCLTILYRITPYPNVFIYDWNMFSDLQSLHLYHKSKNIYKQIFLSSVLDIISQIAGSFEPVENQVGIIYCDLFIKIRPCLDVSKVY